MRTLIAALLLPLSAAAETPVVVIDIAPVHSLAAQVMQGIGDPVLLIEAGGDPHDFQLRPSQAQVLTEADAVFWVGPGLTPWLGGLLANLADPGALLELAEVPGIQARPSMFAGEKPAEAAAEAAHDEAHDHGGEDPHVWLDPRNAAAMMAAMADQLAAIDPANAAAYRANAAAALDELAALDAELEAALAPVREKPFVVFHDAYAHFAVRYGLTVAGALAEGDAADPGAAHVAALRDLVAGGGASCVFAEALHDDRLLLAATEGTNVGHGKLDPEGSALPPGPEVYPAMMRALATTIADCLSAH